MYSLSSRGMVEDCNQREICKGTRHSLSSDRRTHDSNQGQKFSLSGANSEDVISCIPYRENVEVFILR